MVAPSIQIMKLIQVWLSIKALS